MRHSGDGAALGSYICILDSIEERREIEPFECAWTQKLTSMAIFGKIPHPAMRDHFLKTMRFF